MPVLFGFCSRSAENHVSLERLCGAANSSGPKHPPGEIEGFRDRLNGTILARRVLILPRSDPRGEGHRDVKNRRKPLKNNSLRRSIRETERQGFEPWVVPKHYAELAIRCIRPLCHLSWDGLRRRSRKDTVRCPTGQLRVSVDPLKKRQSESRGTSGLGRTGDAIDGKSGNS
jgi:hypothetical protein